MGTIHPRLKCDPTRMIMQLTNPWKKQAHPLVQTIFPPSFIHTHALLWGRWIQKDHVTKNAFPMVITQKTCHKQHSNSATILVCCCLKLAIFRWCISIVQDILCTTKHCFTQYHWIFHRNSFNQLHLQTILWQVPSAHQGSEFWDNIVSRWSYLLRSWILPGC